MQTMAMDLIEKVKEMEGKLEEARETDAAKQRRIDGIDDEVGAIACGCFFFFFFFFFFSFFFWVD